MYYLAFIRKSLPIPALAHPPDFGSFFCPDHWPLDPILNQSCISISYPWFQTYQAPISSLLDSVSTACSPVEPQPGPDVILSQSLAAAPPTHVEVTYVMIKGAVLLWAGVVPIAILVVHWVWIGSCHKTSANALKTPVSEDHKSLQKTDSRQCCRSNGGGHLLSPAWRMSLREQNVGSGMTTAVSKLECGASKRSMRRWQLTRGEVPRPRRIFTKGPFSPCSPHHHNPSFCKQTFFLFFFFFFTVK